MAVGAVERCAFRFAASVPGGVKPIPEGHVVSDVVGLIATYSCLLGTGAFVYVSVVEHPARLDRGAQIGAAHAESHGRLRAHVEQTLRR